MVNNTKALAIQNNRALPVQHMDDIAILGEWFSRSNIAGVQNPAEGFVVASHMVQTGISIVEFTEQYHIIKGRVTKRADAMLADFVRYGGKYRVISRTPERAAIEMTNSNGDTQTFTFTWQEAQNEPFVYEGGFKSQAAQLKLPAQKRTYKDKYSTPRSRMQMLWARVVSDACRVMDPRTNQGMYTPEEADDFIEGEYTVVAAAPRDPVPIDTAKAQEIVNNGNRNGNGNGNGNGISAAADSDTGGDEPEAKSATPDPFIMPQPPQQTNNNAIDFSVCPIQGCDMTNVPWIDMEKGILERALRMKHPAMEPGHYEAIKTAIAEKGE